MGDATYKFYENNVFSEKNLQKALNIGIWGGSENSQIKEIRKNDTVYFFHHLDSKGHKVKAGYPKYKDVKNFFGWFTFIIKGSISETSTKAKNPTFGKNYPYEFKFEIMKEKKDVNSKEIDKDVLENIRRAIIIHKAMKYEGKWDL